MPVEPIIAEVSHKYITHRVRDFVDANIHSPFTGAHNLQYGDVEMIHGVITKFFPNTLPSWYGEYGCVILDDKSNLHEVKDLTRLVKPNFLRFNVVFGQDMYFPVPKNDVNYYTVIHNHYDNTLTFIDEDSISTVVENYHIPSWYNSVGCWTATRFVQKGYLAYLEEEPKRSGTTTVYKICIEKNPYHEIFDKLFRLQRTYDNNGIEFRLLRSVKPVVIRKKVSYEFEIGFKGHEVGGSYVHAHQVAPRYVEELSQITGSTVQWLKYESSTIEGPYNLYTFKVVL